MNMNEASVYHCIECGKLSQCLFRRFNAGIIKVSFCTECGQIIDKYTLCDPVVMLLDALLHKPQVYRHLLYNTNIPSTWKLFLIFFLCDAFMKWGSLHSNDIHRDEAVFETNPVFYAALEVDFYMMSCVAITEWICFILVLLALLKLALPKSISSQDIIRGIIISSFGKLLVIPAIIWGQTQSSIYLLLTQLFVFTSNATALRVLYGCSRLAITCIVAMAWCVQQTCGRYITEHIKNSIL